MALQNETLVFSSPPLHPPPEDPPDGGGGLKHGEDNKSSFRDKLLGNKKAPPPREKTDLLKQGLVRIEHDGGNRLLPRIHIDDGIFNELCHPWRETLVIKLLGKTLGYKTMKYKLSSTWKLSGDFDLMDVDNGYYMVKFDIAEDREKVIGGGPWMIFDHYLAVSEWSPDFVSSSAKIEKTMVWVRFPGMNLVYYDESILMAMASAIGVPVKVDKHTLSVERGRFARVCVEIDLCQPVVGKICVRGSWYKVAYEGLHLICSNCGCYGHLSRNCSTLAKQDPQKTAAGVDGKAMGEPSTRETQTSALIVNNTTHEISATVQKDFVQHNQLEEEVHGDWLVAQGRKRDTRKGVNAKNISTISGPKVVVDPTNRFSLLSMKDHPHVKQQKFSKDKDANLFDVGTTSYVSTSGPKKRQRKNEKVGSSPFKPQIIDGQKSRHGDN